MFQYNDGGRAEAGFQGSASDCVCRALAIATGKPYKEVYDRINVLAGKPVARTGVPKKLTRKIVQSFGFKWVPVMGIGTGCTMTLDPTKLPKGVIICKVTNHLCTVIDGVLNDTHDSSRNGTRCVYGYWVKD